MVVQETMEMEKGGGLKTREGRRRKAYENSSEFEIKGGEEKLAEDGGITSINQVEEAIDGEKAEKEAEKVGGGGGGDANGEHRSVFYDPDQDVELIDDVSLVKLKEVDALAVHEKVVNGKPAVNHAPEVITTERNQLLKNMKAEDGSSSHSYSKVQHEVTKNDNEIEELVHITTLSTSKVKVPEFDLQRILDEQNTHDLICPNCNSCITRRVILRKRKRSHRETSDAPTGKIPKDEHVENLNSDSTAAEMTNDGDEEGPDVFRCLSCFTFFFRIVAGKKERKPVDISGQNTEQKDSLIIPFSQSDRIEKPERDSGADKKEGTQMPQMPKPDQDFKQKGSWIWSFFQSEKNKKPEREQGGGYVVHKEESSFSLTSESLEHGENKTTVQKNDAGDYIVQRKETSSLIVSGQAEEIESIAQKINSDILQHGNIKVPEKVKDQAEYINTSIQVVPPTGTTIHIEKKEIVNDVYSNNDSGNNTITLSISRSDQIIHTSASTLPGAPSQVDLEIGIPGQRNQDYGTRNEWDILKSIVYGGLIESIVSLSVVSSAAGSNASTLNIVAIGLANVIGGIPLISHDLFDLRNTQQVTDERHEHAGRYGELLGRRKNFSRHFVVAIISYILVGLLPALVYGFSFRESDDKNYKLIAVAAASLLCIALLAVGKAHVQTQKLYFETVFYYLCLALPASGISYVAGVMIEKLLEQLGLFNHGSTAPVPPSIGISWDATSLASY